MVQEDSHLLMVLRYIEGNPVRAKMVKSAKEWPWSSHNEALGRHGEGLLDKSPIDGPKAWAEYVDTSLLDNELDRLRKSVNRQAPFGGAVWSARVSREFGLESTMRRKGRPAKKSVR